MPKTPADPAQRIKGFMKEVHASGLYPENPVVNSAATEPVVWVDGRDHLLFCSNNLLGLSNHPDVKKTAQAALERYGLGSGGSRQMAANMDIHLALEHRIAEFLGREDAICFAAGYMANVGVIPAVMKVDYLAALDLRRMASGFYEQRENWKAAGGWDLFSEELNHASGVDGIRLARADVQIYRHVDMAHLEELISASERPSKFIVSDGVFSMDGDIAPVDEITRIGQAHSAMVMIDDAHGIGMLGDRGRGSIEHLGVDPKLVHLQMGTFTKAFGGVGGFVAGDKAIIDFLRVSARTYIFSAPLPPAISSGLTQSIDIAEREGWRREKALDHAHYFRREAQSLGYDTLNSAAHIVPVLIGNEGDAAKMTKELRRRGILAPHARFPAVAPGRALIRFVMTCQHTREQIDYLLKCLDELGRELGIGGGG